GAHRRRRPLSTLVVLLSAWLSAGPGQSKPGADLKNFDLSQVKPDLSRYSTYNWSKDQTAVVNLANHIRLVNAIQRQMKELGYRIDTVKPQAIIQYKADRHTGVHTSSSQKPSTWDPTDMKVQVELNREEQVSLEILLVDAESGFLLWQAKGNYPLGTPDRAEKLINEAVNGLFAEYPKPEKR
ncbi:MAG TPA: DUF4136 domain-containing protein, partial [Vicinamibacteria bacterium]